jgi:tetratricopeptide (TPR) repeat protein
MSKKIGRNDPCPCGSGKKYKHCCLGKKAATINRTTSKSEKPVISQLAIMRFEQKLHDNPEELEKIGKEIEKYSDNKDINFKDFIQRSWSLDKIRKMSTSEIIEKLKSMNIDFETEHFKKQAQNYISAIELAEDYYYTQNFHELGPDEDFIWLAIIELWNRIIPEKWNMEMIDDLMQEGYEDIEKQNYRDGIEKWEKAWNMIKSIVPPHIKSVEDADKFISGLTQSIFNWWPDFVMELANAALEDSSYYFKRIKCCQDFCRIFPDSDELMIKNMLKAEAESYAELGDLETAKKLLKK